MTAAPLAAQFSGETLLATLLGNQAKGIEYLLKSQVTDPASSWQGMLINRYGIPNAVSMAGMYDTYAAALTHPRSKHYRNAEVFARLKMTAAALKRNQSPAGFLSNLDTNFNSPPDTAFGILAAAQGLLVAKQTGEREVFNVMEPFVKSASDGLAVGGIHTPNHRWVVSAALALANDAIPSAAYTKRIDQWLAESIDIDEDGQFTERSMGTYNPIVDSALVTIAARRNRPELFEAVRANLNALLYMINPNGEIVTDFSRRQDQFTRATAGGYYYALHYMALKDKNPVYGGLAEEFRPTRLTLSTAMLHPEFLEPLKSAPVPTSYRKDFTHNRVSRFRRGNQAATVFYNGGSRIASLNKGEAVITAVRFISAFFGRGQFKPQEHKLVDDGILMTQKLEGPYYQPFTPARTIDSEMWGATQKLRPQSEVSTFEQSAFWKEVDGGYDLRIRCAGTQYVPVIIEIALREGGKLDGVTAIPNAVDSYLIAGDEASYRVGGDVIKIGPGSRAHQWTTNIRYIDAKLPGPAIYLTGFAPFDHTVRFRFA